MRSKNVVKNVISSLIKQLANMVSGLILPRQIIITFGSQVNGLVTSITQFLSYIVVMELGIEPVVKALLYKPIANKAKDEIEKILKFAQNFFNKVIYCFLIYLIILCFIYPKIVKEEFSTLYTISLLIIISISVFAEYFLGIIYKLYLESKQKTSVISNIQTITILLNTMISVILIKIGCSIQIVKLVSAFLFVTRQIIQSIYVKKKYNLVLTKDVQELKIKNKFDGMAQHIATNVHENTGYVVLTLFTNTLEVSVYSIYIMVIKGIRSIIMSITNSFDAAFGDMFAKKEEKNLNRNFRVYEFFYFTIITIVYSCTMSLILSFVSVYTNGVTDTNYCRPLFAYGLVISELMWAVRLPYASLILSLGHFKETKKGAWIEAFFNVSISVVLISKLGMTAIAIATFVVMLFRTVEFICHLSSNVLDREKIYSYKWLFLILFEFTLIFIINNSIIAKANITSYMTWSKYGIIILLIDMILVLILNGIFHKKEMIMMIKTIRNLL